jgi:uncharacterized tellurite resistance protein B-like protein
MNDMHQDYSIGLLQAMFAVAAADNKITGRERSVIYSIATSRSIGLQKSDVTRELKKLVGRVRRSGRQETIDEIVNQFNRGVPAYHDESQFMQWLEQVAIADGDKETGEIRVMKQLRQVSPDPPTQPAASDGLLAALHVAGNAPVSHRQTRSTGSPAGVSHFNRSRSRASRKRPVNHRESTAEKRNHAKSILGGSIAAFLFFSYVLFMQWQEGKTTESWEPIEALVTAREMRESRRNRYNDEPEMDMAWETHVQYTVNGTTYNRIFNKYSARKTMTIYYNPANPGQSTVTQGLEWIFFIILCLVLIVSAVGVLVGATLSFWPHLMSNDY